MIELIFDPWTGVAFYLTIGGLFQIIEDRIPDLSWGRFLALIFFWPFVVIGTLLGFYDFQS